VFPDVSVLKLGMSYPLPEELIRSFSGRVETLVVVEELDPFFELRIRALGLPVSGKQYIPLTGELNPEIIRSGLNEIVPAELDRLGERETLTTNVNLPPRPPTLCPGCPHRTVFNLLGKKGVIVSGDIGCYTLGVLPPFSAMDTCVEMGGSIGMAQGMEAAMGDESSDKVVAVIGDSTFAHSGIAGLVNAAYNKRHSVIIVLDNGTTAMTGMQPNPLSGERINGEETVAIDYQKLGEAMGMKTDDIYLVDAYDRGTVERAVSEGLSKKELCLIVVRGPCVILKKRKKAGP
jgi:indolepyruvate ferredoxin oxidoreductase alpha subunit